jgi:phosphoribosylaminoimidazolecarboxamide formyltransferase/IMP cyclohydrolase
VVVNLYPFRATVTSSPPPAFEVGVENIDIGGPAMIRAAAKNHAFVTVVVDPSDYDTLLEQLKGGSSEAEALAFRKKMAWKAYQHTASYDAQVRKAKAGGGGQQWGQL